MHDYYDKIIESGNNPTEIVPVICAFYNDDSNIYFTGSLLNGKSERGYTWYYRTGTIESTIFFKDGLYHGETIRYNQCGIVLRHAFYKHQVHIPELDYLINEERDDAFYVTLALYGIGKEYTIGAE